MLKEELEEALNLSKLIFPGPGYEVEQFTQEGPYVLFYEKRDGKVVSFLIGTLIGDEMEIDQIGTLSSYRSQGLARNLLERFFAYGIEHKASQVFLEVRKDNLKAIALYESVGFTCYKIRPGYYDGVDAKLYRKEL